MRIYVSEWSTRQSVMEIAGRELGTGYL